MLSARSRWQEIVDHDGAYRLFCSLEAGDAAVRGWEHARAAALLPESEREQAYRAARQAADEAARGRLFRALLRRRGLTAVPVPAELDYRRLLERRGAGPAHDRLRGDRPLSTHDVLRHLALGRVTGQRAVDRTTALVRYFGDHPELGRTVRTVADRAEDHLACCREELLRLSRAGHRRTVRLLLRDAALTESEVHRDVRLAELERMGRILLWSRAECAVPAAGVYAAYAVERLGGLRRQAVLRPPRRREAPAAPTTEPV